MPNAPQPPMALEAEEYVLGAMMISQKAIDAVLDVGLISGDFYRESHGRVFDAIVALYVESVPADPLTVVAKLTSLGQLADIGGPDRIREIATIVPVAANVAHHAEIVRKTAVLRATIIAGLRIQQLAQQGEGELPEILDQVEGVIFEIAQKRRRTDFVTVRETVRDAFARIEDAQTAGKLVGLPSGYVTIDQLTGGFQPGNLIIVAARPSMGKTGLALGIVANVALRSRLPVALFSLEMNRDEVTQRLLASEALVEASKIRDGKLDRDEWSRLATAGAKLDSAEILIDDTADLTGIELRSKARKLALRHPDLALVVVDYIQLMTSGQRADSRVQDVSQVSRSLKVLASELRCPVVALSQLNRSVETRHDHRPWLSDLRESGALEQDADLVAFIYRDEYYNPEDTDQQGIAEVDIAKHRNGPTGMVKLSFVKRYVRFSDLPRGDGVAPAYGQD
jgi:replicative DNA helicase